MGEMNTLNSSGDSQFIWDKNDEDEVEEARAYYNKMLKKGFIAFKVGAGGKKLSTQIDEFDPNIGKIIFARPVAGG